MKKLVLLFVCLFTLQSVVWADDDKPIKVNELPKQSQQFIKQHFADSSIAIAKKESSWFDKGYDVIFTNGNKVEFDGNGNWKEIDCKYTAVPSNVIPVAIQGYVTANYPGVNVLKIDRDKRDYEVKLSNRLEMKFDLQFNLIDIDN